MILLQVFFEISRAKNWVRLGVRRAGRSLARRGAGILEERQDSLTHRTLLEYSGKETVVNTAYPFVD